MNPELHPIPDELERRKLFYWLKKASSYTAYERVGRYYKVWVDEFKTLYDDSQRHPDSERGALMAPDKIVTVMSCYAAFEEALKRLRNGSKRPFVWLGRSGHFSEAARAGDYWLEATSRGERGDNVIEAMFSPHWPAVKQAMSELSSAWGEVGVVLQNRHTDLPAEIGLANDADRCCKFPPGELPEVPIPVRTVLVQTGDIVPCFGIWEPVKADFSPGFVGLFKKPVVPESGEFELDGCMNYLHQGSAAPTIWMEDDGPRNEGRPTVWHLIWEDTRYRDGVIPDEERSYPFFDVTEEAAAAVVPDGSSAGEAPIYAQSGDVASKSGSWAAMDDLHGRTAVKAGEVLPMHQGRQVRWVWVSV